MFFYNKHHVRSQKLSIWSQIKWPADIFDGDPALHESWTLICPWNAWGLGWRIVKVPYNTSGGEMDWDEGLSGYRIIRQVVRVKRVTSSDWIDHRATFGRSGRSPTDGDQDERFGRRRRGVLEPEQILHINLSTMSSGLCYCAHLTWYIDIIQLHLILGRQLVYNTFI